MKIIKKGTFLSNGMPDDWSFSMEGTSLKQRQNLNTVTVAVSGDPLQSSLMYFAPDGGVFVRDVEIVEWSEERKKAMGLWRYEKKTLSVN